MKTAPAFHLYLVGDLEQNGVAKVLSDLGLVGQALGDPPSVVQPALIVLGPGQNPAPHPPLAGAFDCVIAGARVASFRKLNEQPFSQV